MGAYDNVALTVNAETRNYTKGFVGKYAAEIAKGNTAISKCDITGGRSVLRVSHEVVSGQSRHLVSVEDQTAGTDGSEKLVKAHVVISCLDGDPTAEQEAEYLVLGLLGWLDDAGVVTSILDSDL